VHILCSELISNALSHKNNLFSNKSLEIIDSLEFIDSLKIIDSSEFESDELNELTES
jgi:hypothetical protein